MSYLMSAELYKVWKSFTWRGLTRDHHFFDFHEQQKFCMRTWIELLTCWKVNLYVCFP